MGAAPVPTPDRSAAGPHRRPPWVKLLVAAGLGLIGLVQLGSLGAPRAPPTPQAEQPAPGGEEADWAKIEPSRELVWHGCFDGQFDCARLDLPMDWLDPSDEQRVVLAIMRLRAVSTTDYRGPVFFNPGGPGGSGVWALRDHGEQLQTIVGDNHDVVSFDPRGIAASVPRIECWHTVQSNRFWNLQDVGVIDSHPGLLYDAFARASAFSRLCQANLEETGILHHSSTTYHARDMLEILDLMGEEKLKYWGFSYGTILGGTFAAMYPDRVGRLVSDGNVDLGEWYNSERINFNRDTDKVMAAFYHYCHLAGPSGCAMYAPSAGEVEARLDGLLAELRVAPVVVSQGELGPEVPVLVTYSRVKEMISTMLYQPVRMFGRSAEVLAALEAGDGRPFYEYRLAGTSRLSAVCSLETVPPTMPLAGSVEDTDDAFPGIMCSDGEQLGGSVREFEPYAAAVQEISRAAGAVQVMSRISCAGRTVRPKWRFSGPFAGNTSSPILFVANAADNITPLASARNNSAGFPGSVVLVQSSYGHTSLAAASTCTARHVRDYFQDGSLPAPDTICEPDVYPFAAPGAVAAGPRTLGTPGGDAELSRAVRRLSEEASWGVGFMTPRAARAAI